MNKFKIGDIVKLKDNLVDREKYGCIRFCSEMRDKFNTARKIINADVDNTYEVEGSPYWYSEDMLILDSVSERRNAYENGYRDAVKDIADWLEDKGYLSFVQQEEYYNKFMKSISKE